jgi:hypothetical protein
MFNNNRNLVGDVAGKSLTNFSPSLTIFQYYNQTYMLIGLFLSRPLTKLQPGIGYSLLSFSDRILCFQVFLYWEAG